MAGSGTTTLKVLKMLARAVVGDKNPPLRCEPIGVKHVYQQIKLRPTVVKSLPIIYTLGAALKGCNYTATYFVRS